VLDDYAGTDAPKGMVLFSPRYRQLKSIQRYNGVVNGGLIKRFHTDRAFADNAILKNLIGRQKSQPWWYRIEDPKRRD